ncbi:MAG TPA: glutathione S-transferase family protein [Burkholderiaceae bacterium]|nr:glutathione S-transferase family protein [Burkholderiaceae bacterium]
MTVRISTFAWVPPVAQGLVRDLRVRWALEEAGLPYDERPVRLGDHSAPDYVALQPFGQIPAYQEDGLTLFESGAIVLHIAERCQTLLPAEPKRRARAKTWMFAALNTVEPPIMFLNWLQQMNSAEGNALRKPVNDWVQKRLHSLGDWLNDRSYLEDRFTAADLLMSTVLRILQTTDLVSAIPSLAAYHSRCEGRPAFQRALSAQMATFQESEPSLQHSR